MRKKLSIICTTIIIGFLIAGCGPASNELEEKGISKAAIKISPDNTLDLETRTPGDKKFIKTAETKFKVSNVRVASEKIEDLAAKYSGYLTYSDLRNNESDLSQIKTGNDSILLTKKIVVENKIVLRIPNESLDSLVRELNKLILFLDYRIIKMDDISFSLLTNQKASERLKNYDLRQKKHIDTKESKLKETSAAEENVLNRQTQADNLQVEYLSLTDQTHYCTLTIIIYQKPIIYNETQVLLNTDSFRPNLFVRIFDAVVDGWILFEYFIVFLFKIWWFFVLVAVGILIYRLWLKPKKMK